MSQPANVETLLQEAIALLEESGFPMAAQSLRDNLTSIRGAPTGAARRRRVFQLKDLLDGGGPACAGFYDATPYGRDVLRHRRLTAHRGHEERYRATLRSIQELLSPERGDESDPDDWSPSMDRVA
jgi:hypothetical protein